MGTTLKRYFSFKALEKSLSEVSYFKKPSMINDDTVSPGCTLADNTIDLLALGLPMVRMGISLPSYVLPRDSDHTSPFFTRFLDNKFTLLYSYG